MYVPRDEDLVMTLICNCKHHSRLSYRIQTLSLVIMTDPSYVSRYWIFPCCLPFFALSPVRLLCSIAKTPKVITLHFCPSGCLSHYWPVECTVAPARKLSEHLLVHRSTLLLAGDDQDLVAHTQSSLVPALSILLTRRDLQTPRERVQVTASIQ